uniref:Uncharacterized protein n=1 Tax=Megaviridae environmental sample TaxID=1737588 RepID=A0A5J6VI72_9VIRU|nr:MAG: hypothetical protein [Megaviridae environmental sample]
MIKQDWINFKNTYAKVIASRNISSLSITQLLLLVTFLIEIHNPNAREQDLKDMFEHVKTIFVSNKILETTPKSLPRLSRRVHLLMHHRKCKTNSLIQELENKMK